MILKKPYAFLIKNFRIIHIILSVVIIGINILYGNINNFYSGYVKGTVRDTIGLASKYINPLLYLLLFIVITFALIMFLLMRKKQKPTFFYITLFIYYLILLIMVIIAANVMKSVETSSLTQQASRAYRDIYLIVSLPRYYFMVISIIRGIGFDVKKFNFSKDLEELEIKSEDNEEFEFVLGTEGYKYKRKVRRTLRELKYYILENKFIFSIIVGGVLIVILSSVIIHNNILNKTYKVGSSGAIGTFTYNMIGAYETKYDYNGKLISKGKKYLILDMIIINRSGNSQVLTNVSMFLKAGNDSIYNMPSLKNYFVDFGKTYLNDEIPGNTTNNYILIFEIDDKTNYKNYYLNILKNIETKDGETFYNYSKFKIKPIVLNNTPAVLEKKPNEVMYFGANIFKETNLTFKSIEIKSSYEYKYEICNKEDCTEYYDVVAPDNSADNSLLVLNYKLDVKDNIGLKQTTTSDKSFFDKFIKIEYNYYGKIVTKNVNSKIVKTLDNIVFIEIPKAAIRSDLVNLLISGRNYKYYINLKEI